MNLKETKEALDINKGRGFSADHKGTKVRVVSLKELEAQPSENRTTAVSPGGAPKIKKQKLETKHVAVLHTGAEVELTELTRI